MKRYIHPSEEVVIYYWFDGGVLRETGEASVAEKAIISHDYDTFMQFRKTYGDSRYTPFFPSSASVFDKSTGDYMYSIDIDDVENFNRIDDTDYEWG